MEIEIQNSDSGARLIVKSGLLDWRRHNRLVDEILLCGQQLVAEQYGFLFRTTIITGASIQIMYAQTLLELNGYEVVEGL